MDNCFASRPAHDNGGYAKCDLMSNKVTVNLRAQNIDCKNRQGLGHVATYRLEPHFCTASTSSAGPYSHQRRWSADICKCQTSILIVKKNKKEPQPPKRSVSLPEPNTAAPCSFKRYSCPPIGVFSSPSYLSLSSSSSSTCSCSSPPPVQTSVITGHDPRGWKLRPKSSCTSPEARTKRLSLPIPLPVVSPDSKSRSAPNSQSDSTPNPDPSPRSKPPLKPKPFRRRHSDSSAFLRSLANPLPLVTLEELCTVHLRPISLSDESDDVFSFRNEEEVQVTTLRRKVPPPVPIKSSMARQIAQLIAHSRKRCENNEERIYCSVVKSKAKHSQKPEENHSILHERKTAELRVEISSDRERPTPRFPG